jgi:hypothetical protein
MTPEIDAIKTTIREFRAALVTAERELVSAYGSRIAPLAGLLCTCFDAGELRRFVHYSLGASGANALPDQCSLMELAQASAIAFADAEASRATLHTMLLRARPHRARDIEASLNGWVPRE